MKIKKVVSLLMSIILTVVNVSFVFANTNRAKNDDTSVNLMYTSEVYALENANIYYDVQSGYIVDAQVSGGAVEIPEEINGVKICGIYKEAFQNCIKLEAITLPDSIESIGMSAFENCSGLESINIPDGITSINMDVFKDCHSLKSMKLPDSCTYIYSNAFEDCHSLESINIPDSVKLIKDYAFKGCSSLKSIDIPEETILYASLLFADCSSLTSVSLPSNMTSIDNAMFSNCSSLKNINIPENVTKIEESAFYGCSDLETINISDKIISIGKDAFMGCTGVTSINVNKDNEYYTVENGILLNKEKTELILYPAKKADIEYIIPEGITKVCNYAFYGCDNIESLGISATVKEMDSYGIKNMKNIKEINVSADNSYFSSDSGVLFNKAKSELISYPCKKTDKEYKIPDSVRWVYNAFYDCNELERIYIPANGYITENIFYRCNSLSYIEVDDNNEYCCDVNGVLFNKDKTSVIAYPVNRAEVVYEIPQGVETVGYESFKNCYKLNKVVISDSVKYILASAFENCVDLKEVNISNSVKEIHEEAFINCTSLGKVFIPDTVTYIFKKAFSGCDNLVIYCNKGSEAQWYADSNNIPYVIISEITVLYGDMDNSGSLSANDSVCLLQKVLNGSYVLPVEQQGYDALSIGDVDGDNVLTASDSAMVLQRVLTNSFVFPVEQL